MAKRTFTKVLVALGLIFNAAFAVNAQQLTFSMSPNLVTPNVGDTVNIGIVVNGFSCMNSFQFTIEWDPALFAPVRPATGMSTPTVVDSVSMPNADANQFLYNALPSNNALTVGWNANGNAKFLPEGHRIFRMRLRVLAASTNYWAKFSSRFSIIEAERAVGCVAGSGGGVATVITPNFVPLGTPPGTSVTPVALIAGTASTTVNQKVCVPVTTNDFTNIISSSWTNRWTPATLRYDSVTNLNTTLGLAAANFTPNVAAGTLAFSKTYATAQNLAASTKLFDVCYTALAVGTSAVSFETPALSKQVSGVTSSATTSLTSGSVTVSPAQSSNTLKFVVGNTIINQAGKASVKVKVAGFTDLASVQYSIRWDSTKMLFDSVVSSALDIQTHIGRGQGNGNFFNGYQRPTGNFWTGSLNFVWVDGLGANRSLVDSTTLFEIFFTYAGASGSCTPVIITGLPVTIACGREDGTRVVPTIVNGSVCLTAGTQPIVTTPTLTQVTCPSGNNGAITLAVSGGTGTYTYNWGGGITTRDRTGLAAGSYTVTITSGTETKVETFNITQPAAFALTPSITHVSCFGQATGNIALSASGGTGALTYAWSNGTANQNLNNVVAGTYSVTVTDSRACSTSVANLTITQPAAALSIPTPTVANVACNGGNNGSITVAPVGGTPPYTYNWTGPNSFTASTATISSLRAGTYSLTVTDSKSCAQTYVGNVAEPAAIAVGSSTIVGTRCSNRTGSITLNDITGGNGGNTFAWTGPNAYTSTSRNITGLAPGNYNLVITDSRGCTHTPTAFVVVDTPSSITFSTPSVVNVACNGNSTGSINLTVSGTMGTVTYAWTGPNGFTASTLNISNLRAGDYTLVIGDGSSCPATRTVTVTQPEALRVVSLTKTDVKCRNGNDGAITLQVAGGVSPQYTYAWTGPNGYSSTSQSPTGLSAGKYVITFKDNNNCEKQDSITVGQPTDSLKITAATVNNVSCNGLTDGSIALTVSGGTPNYRYAWTGPLGTASTAIVSSLRFGAGYQVVVTDANNCTTSATYEITQPDPLSITASTTDATGTPNGSITLTVNGGNGGNRYQWAGTGVSPNAQNQTGLCPGTYNVTVTDSKNCRTTRTITVGGACSALLTYAGGEKQNAGCVGQNLGSVSVNWTGGTPNFTVTWYRVGSASAVSTQNINGRTTAINNLPAGTYYAVITDSSIPTSQSIETPRVEVAGNAAPLNLSVAVSNETCIGNDGSITVIVAQGASPYNYKWADITDDISTRRNLQAGSYSVTIKDRNGCIKDTNMIMVPRTACPLSATTQTTEPKCFGGNDGKIRVNITNGEPVYKIKWTANDSVINISAAGTRAVTYEIPNLRAGTYMVTITDTVRGRQILLPVTIGQPTMISLSKTVSPQSGSCNGSIVITGSGGTGILTYRWNTGATSKDLFGLCCGPNVYSVTATDANGCTVSTGNDTIPCSFPVLAFNNPFISQPNCKSDSMNWRIIVSVSGGSQPYTYTWRNDRGQIVATSNEINTGNTLPPGRYTIIVTDNQTPARSISQDFFISVRSTLDVNNIVTEDASDNTAADGKVRFDILPGVGPYIVNFGNGSPTITVPQGNPITQVSNTSVRAGSYTATIIDNNGCRFTVPYIVRSKKCLTLLMNSDTIPCSGRCDGRASIIDQSPLFKAPFNFNWSNGEKGLVAISLCAGLNSVTMTDANGASCNVSFLLKEPAKVEAEIKVDRTARCIDAVVTGGTKPYYYRWTTPRSDTVRKACDMPSGRYIVVISDRNGCNTSKETEVYWDKECLKGALLISPNDDGKNEEFKINTSGCVYKSIRLEVYNRWGALVFAKDNYQNTWTGNDQADKPLADGVYMYLIKGTNDLGELETVKGTVTIVRE
jgi:gliding motility-associated-like protein